MRRCLILFALIAGCGPRAPRELGVIVAGARAGEIDAVIARHPAARVRRLRRDLVEVFGVSPAEVRGQLPRAAVSPNAFLPRRPAAALRFGHLDDIRARAAWRLGEGRGVTLAVIDTGVDVTHPALIGAVNSPGHDFVDGDDDPADHDGHGTYVASLALGRPFGVARAATLLPVRALTKDGGDVASLVAAITWAVDHGARVVNLSAGVTLPRAHPALTAALAYAERRDVLLVTAAGNGDESTGLGFDLDRTPLYPASLRAANVLVVAASNHFDPLATYSNFGRSTIDVTAPGGLLPDDPVWAAGLGGHYVTGAGTSAAAPLAAGVAALVRAARPRLDARAVRELIATSGPADASLVPVTRTGRRLDAYAALAYALQRSAPSQARR